MDWGFTLILRVGNKEKVWMWSTGSGRLEHEEVWERDGVSPKSCLLLIVIILSYCLQFLLPNKSNFRNHHLNSGLSPLSFKPTDSKRSNLCLFFSLCLFFLSVPAGGCGIWATICWVSVLSGSGCSAVVSCPGCSPMNSPQWTAWVVWRTSSSVCT